MQRYMITAGSFRSDDGTILNVGEQIMLEDDVARLHADKLQAFPEEVAAQDLVPVHDPIPQASNDPKSDN